MVNGAAADGHRGRAATGLRPTRVLHPDEGDRTAVSDVTPSRREPVDGQDRGQWFGGAEFQEPLARVRRARCRAHFFSSLPITSRAMAFVARRRAATVAQAS